MLVRCLCSAGLLLCRSAALPLVLSRLDLCRPIVLCLGAIAHGKAEVDWVEDYISVSSYPLSGSVAAGKFCNAFENHWDIL